MAIEIHRADLEQRVRQQIQSGRFQGVEELLTRALDALAEKEMVSASPSDLSKPSQRIVDALLASPFAHSELFIPARRKDDPRPVSL